MLEKNEIENQRPHTIGCIRVLVLSIKLCNVLLLCNTTSTENQLKWVHHCFTANFF